MGGFYFYNNKNEYDLNAVDEVFRKKYFDNRIKMEIGDWTLVYFPKQTEKISSFVKSDKGFIVCIGALLYKDYPIAEVPKRLLDDLLSGDINYDEMQGHYTIIWEKNQTLYLIMDTLLTKHVFCLDSFDFFSSSMLACCNASKNPIHIDKESICEKAMTGIILSPDTLFREVKSINSTLVDEIEKTNESLKVIIPPNSLNEPPEIGTDFSKEVNNQLTVLNELFKKYKQHAGKLMVDTGLSAGYDSRLLFSLLAKYFYNQLHTHTHNTEGVHGKERDISLELAKTKGIPCETIHTLRADKVDDLQSLIEDNLYFFDGRSSFVIGGVNQTYTADYRRAATDEASITFTGVGGEIYRNYYHFTRYHKKLDWYLRKNIICNNYWKSLDNKLLKENTWHRFQKKLEKHFKCNLTAMKGVHFFRRYYAELMMADGQGVMIDAYNQVSECFAPFITEKIVKASYMDLKCIGIDGVFEAAMIDSIDHELALQPSTYGHNMVKIPKQFLLKQYIKGIMPNNLWNTIGMLLPRNRKAKGKDPVQKALENNQLYQNAIEYFHQRIPEINTDILFGGRYEFKNMSIVILTVYLLRKKIEENE